MSNESDEPDKFSDTPFHLTKPRDVPSLLKDPLNKMTRDERRYLLGVSGAGIAMVKANLVPKEITTLGIKIGDINRTYLLWCVAIVVSYFLIAFFLYALSDVIEWRVRYQEATTILRQTVNGNDQTFRKEKAIIRSSVSPIAWLRLLFDVLFPIVIAVIAVIILLQAA
jgi:hypothetical protein